MRTSAECRPFSIRSSLPRWASCVLKMRASEASPARCRAAWTSSPETFDEASVLGEANQEKDALEKQLLLSNLMLCLRLEADDPSGLRAPLGTQHDLARPGERQARTNFTPKELSALSSGKAAMAGHETENTWLKNAQGKRISCSSRKPKMRMLFV